MIYCEDKNCKFWTEDCKCNFTECNREEIDEFEGTIIGNYSNYYDNN